MNKALLLEYRNYNTGKLRKGSGARPFSCHQFRFELERFWGLPVDRPSQKELINLDYSNYSDLVFLEHPAANNYKGFNTREIGMIRDVLVNLVQNFKKKKKLHVLFPLKSDDLNTVIESYNKRREKSNNWFPKIDDIIYSAYMNQIDFLGHRVYPRQKILYGDSHSHAIWTPDYHIHKFQYGKTLYSFLKNINLTEFDGLTKNTLTFFFGTIDIHHHLAMYSNNSTKDLAKDYAEFLNWLLKDKKTKNIIVYLPLRPYPEDREIKKAYWYKGSPYHGSYLSRLIIWNLFVNTLEENLNKYIKIYYPKEEFDFKNHSIYEPQKGIHLRSNYYEWNFSSNSKNKNSIWRLI